MALSDVWNRTLVYFGIAEEEEWDDEALVTEERLEKEYESRSSRHNVRRLPQRSDPDEWSEPDSTSLEQAPRSRRGRLRAADASAGQGQRQGHGQVQVHLVLPSSFNDAKQIADRFKSSVPVILNLQSADADLSKRLIDFSSGLTYALDGSMQRIADRVFLLTPRNVEVSAEERARALDRGGFFNQA